MTELRKAAGSPQYKLNQDICISIILLKVNMTELLGRPLGLFIGLLIGFQFLLSWLFTGYKIRPSGVKLLKMFKEEKEKEE